MRSAFPQVLTVGVFPAQTAVEEPHFPAKDIVPKSPTAETEPVLPLPWTDPFEFSDVIRPSEVLRVSLEDLDGLGVAVSEIRVGFRELLE